MTAESFEQIAKAGQASGDFTKTWEIFVNTRFYAPIVNQPGKTAVAEIHFSVIASPVDGKPFLMVSEVVERVDNQNTNQTTQLLGADIVAMLNPQVSIMVALSDRGFGIPAEQVSLLKRSAQRYDVNARAPLADISPALLSRAQQGDPEAQSELAAHYLQIKEIPNHLQLALDWYRKAAGNGHVEAQFLLGNHYRHLPGAQRDSVESLKWLLKAAEKGHAKAQVGLAYMYKSGEGTPVNYPAALHWYAQAADKGDDLAQLELGLMYDRGLGSAQDYIEAAKWYTKAALQGNAQAQFNLGALHNNGSGVAVDLVQSYKWMTISTASSASGSKEHMKASGALKDLTARMSPAQIKCAQLDAADWLKARNRKN